MNNSIKEHNPWGMCLFRELTKPSPLWSGLPVNQTPFGVRGILPTNKKMRFELGPFSPLPFHLLCHENMLLKNEPVLLTAGEVMPHVDPGGRRAWACSSWPSCSREEAQQLGGGQWPQEPLLAGCPPDLTAAWVKGRINFLFSLPDAGSI